PLVVPGRNERAVDRQVESHPYTRLARWRELATPVEEVVERASVNKTRRLMFEHAGQLPARTYNCCARTGPRPPAQVLRVDVIDDCPARTGVKDRAER